MQIDGLVSGLDTTSIISQLMQIEAQPRDALSARKDTVNAKIQAYAGIATKLSAIAAAAGKLSTPAAWRTRTATVSDPTVASTTVTGTADVGALSFTVDQLSAAHALRSTNTIASTDTVIAASGTVTVDLGDGPTDISVGSGSLADVVAGVNAAGLRIRATAVNTGSGYRLQLTANTSGAASAFSVTAGLDGAGGVTTLTTGQDAQLTIGSGPGAYTVTSASNTFADLEPGLSVTALKTSAVPVTVTVDDDAGKLADHVQSMVDATNAALDEITDQTAYDAAKNQASTLTGDNTVRQIRLALSRAVGDAVSQSTLKSGAFAGLSADRTGKVTFDRDKFLSAYEANPSDVSRLFVQGGTGTGSVTFVSAGARTTDGTHTVVVTQAPAAATDTGLAGGFPLAADTTIRLKVGTTEVHYDATAGESATSVAAGLQSAATAAGLPLAIAQGGGGVTVTHTDVGSFNGFSVAWDGSTWTDHAGTDIAGTIDGVAALGSGRQLASPLGQPGSGGLVVDVAGSGTGTVGTVEYSAGIAQRLASVAAAATDVADGSLTTAQDAGKRQIVDFDTQIANYTLRLTAYETGLRKQFSTLETTLSQLKSQSSWLASQLGSLGSS